MTSFPSERTHELWRALIARSVTVSPETGEVSPPTGAVSKLPRAQFLARALEISNRCASRRVLDARSVDEILGFNTFGAFD